LLQRKRRLRPINAIIRKKIPHSFKNILKLVEIKELIEQEDIKIGRLNYEKKTIFNALSLKREEFEKEQQKIEK